MARAKAPAKSPTVKASVTASSGTAEPRQEVKTETTQKQQSNKPADAEQLPVIFVRSRGKQFYRAGMKFTEHGHGIALEVLTDEQLEAIRNEPQLIVEDGTIDPASAE